MTEERQKLAEFMELLGALREETITQQQCNRLEDMLTSSGKLRQYYRIYVQMCTELRSRRKAAAISETDSTVVAESAGLDQGEAVYNELMRALAENEKTAAEIEITKPKPRPEPVIVHKIAVDKRQRRISKVSLYTAIISTAALIIVMAYVMANPRYQPPEVAILTEVVKAQWSNPELPSEQNSNLRVGAMELVKGFVEIKLDDGARVILEAPAKLDLEGPSSVFLHYGKLTANVPKHAVGFKVNTPTASVVDLGTEFGMRVNKNGSSDLHMLTGKASIIAGKGGDAKNCQMVLAGKAKSVGTSGNNVKDIEIDRGAFVRRIDSKSGVVVRIPSLRQSNTVRLITSNTNDDPKFPVENLIDGRGLAGDDPVECEIDNDAWATKTYHSNYFDHFGPVKLLFDFGEDKYVDAIYIWAYTQGTGISNTYQGNTMKDFELRFNAAEEGRIFKGRTELVGTADHGPVCGTYPDGPLSKIARQDFEFDTVIKARYIEMTITSNYYGVKGSAGGDRVGAGEIWFRTIDVEGDAEPEMIEQLNLR